MAARYLKYALIGQDNKNWYKVQNEILHDLAKHVDKPFGYVADVPTAKN